MIGIKVTISNPEIFNNLSKLIKIQTQAKPSKTAVKRAKRVKTAIETSFSKVFGSANISYGGNATDSDFAITNNQSVALFRKLFGNDVRIDKPSIDFVNNTTVDSKRVASVGNSGNSDNNINRAMSSLTGGVIDPTQYSMTQAIRNNTERVGKEVVSTIASVLHATKDTISQKQLASSISDLNELVNGDLSLVSSNNKNQLKNNIKKIQRLYKSYDTKSSTSVITSYNSIVDSINGLLTQIENESPLGILKARMAQVGDVFDLVTSVPQIKAQFYARSKTVQISYLNEANKTVDVYNMQIPLSSFKSSYFNTKVSGDKVSIQLNPEIEAKILANTVPGILNIDDKLEDFSAQFNKISSRSFTPTSSGFTGSEYIGVAESKVAKGKISLREKAKKWTRIRRITTGKEIIQEPKRTSMNAFISSKFLTTEVMKEMSKRMPHGPIGGYPLAKTILTYRTGRFVNSLRMFIDYRTNMVQYYYNPMYYIHETTARNPKRLIESSTRTILSSFFTRQFKILKGA